ncbi:acyl CoA:acetate/3-ketoacid CoA transferase [Paraburkholderia acidisoli]|uniref:Acetate CoA-transferase YdiF n=1 Tax=Paraburkholderia acidisoli TaxID=2571748 RepID=A0A7Z2GMI6_9BURK|nr:CoA-transferase [Paraburkholderia acidisoli]QGZ64289.1 acyl CoA:acetate/3-ketoacid CoA transferase [Paraburkholderia acidisoli]
MKKTVLAQSELAGWLASVGDGATVVTTGSGGGLLEPDELLAGFEAAFLKTGHPAQLTLVHALGIGDKSAKGTNRFAHEGMVKRVIGGHWTWSPKMLDMARDGEIEAYCLPSGAIVHLVREIGAGRPGLFTHVGLGTFVDPRLGGGRVNANTTEEIVELATIDGREYLRYKPFKVDIGLVRGTVADEDGNISAIEEPADLDAYNVALAAHNCGGKVIAQVREIVPRGTIRPREVSIPGNLVDAIVVCPEQMQTYFGDYDLSLAGLVQSDEHPPMPDFSDAMRRIIAGRAAQELVPGSTLNFGFGMSADVAALIAQRGAKGEYWFTVEQGLHNGSLMTGDLFGIARNPSAIVSSAAQFDLYSGGGLDQTFLGMAEMDGHGNVNVSHIAGRMSGPGGFIDITQGARSIVFCGSFAAKGLKVHAADGQLTIASHGQIPKLVEHVSGITFSGAEAIRRGQQVTYVTERAVFRLTAEGIELIEVAPGVDIQRDILDRMAFTPIVRSPKPMDAALFASSDALTHAY